MNRDTLVTLLKYKRWADAGTLASVKAVDATAHPEKRRLMQRLMNHIYVVDRIFQANLTGQAHGYTALNTPETPDVETLETTMRDCVDGYTLPSDDALRQAQDDIDDFIGQNLLV